MLTRRHVFAQSWPIILANAAAPIVGLVDTFVIGRYTDTTALAGIGLGAVIYGILYWGFGFLRMSTAGLTAQSYGAHDFRNVQAHIMRAVPLGFLIGLIVLIAQLPLLWGAFQIYTAPGVIEDSAAVYIRSRLWGLPATLSSIALMGWFVGIGRAQLALYMQIALNIVNILLSPFFVISLGWGLYGVGLASAIAEWVGLVAGLTLALFAMRQQGGIYWDNFQKAAFFAGDQIRKLGVANSNIFIRTLSLTVGFNFFADRAANQGEVFLASNHILLQFITMSALILDAFAHTAEAATGAAYGAKDRAGFDRAVRLTNQFSGLFGLICGALIMTVGWIAIGYLSKDPAVISMARQFLPFCALAPVIGFPAWQLDGIFIGTTQTAQMRNAGIASVALYIIAHFSLTALMPDIWAGHAIWIAFLSYYVFRSLTLLLYYPAIRPADQQHPISD